MNIKRLEKRKRVTPVDDARKQASVAVSARTNSELPEQFTVFAVAAPGLAPLVAAECIELGLSPLSITSAGVTLRVTRRELFVLNCWSRVATRIIVRLATFPARDFATLERRARRVNWSSVLAPGSSVNIRVTCRKSRLYHSDAVAERLARVVVEVVPGVQVIHGNANDDHSTQEAGDSDSHEAHQSEQERNSQLIIVRLDRDECTISADSSGELLHKRGWRQAIAKAPLRETLAAAMLVALEWDGSQPLVDPFCGSGTIGIEAALRARSIAPGLCRSFAMENWPEADVAMYSDVRRLARAQVKRSTLAPIVLRDRDAGAIAAARANAKRAGVLDDLVIEHAALSETDLSSLGPNGMVVTNPPYGHRISEGGDLRSLFARLGRVVADGGPGWQLALLMPYDRQLIGQLRSRFSTVFETSNGGLSVVLLRSQASET